MQSPASLDPALALEELQLRTRSMLALMRSVIRRTLDAELASAALLLGRIEAISRTHAIIIRSPLAAVSLRELIDLALQPHSLPPSVSVAVDGPPVEMRSAAAQIFGLAIHELVANSVQHGAIGEGAGAIRIEWTVFADGGLRFRWQEQSTAAHRPPRDGFGTSLILNALPYELKAQPALDLDRGNVDLRVDLPCDHIIRMAE